jgi:hypothetical protein
MPICVGPSASAVFVAPTLTLNASTNYNQNSGVLNATVTATGNKPITSVEFQWSTSSTFASGNSAWTAASTNTTISQGTTNTARTFSPTGLSNNTTYYVRFRATNANGFVTTSSIGASFKTYRSITDTFTSSSTWTNPVPTSGTNGLAITSGTATVWGGGGGGSYGGGGGGGYVSSTVSVGSSVSYTVGGGGVGAGFGDPSTTGSASSFGSAVANGGGADTGFSYTGGSSGNGQAGGSGGGSPRPAGGGGGGLGGGGSNGNPNAYLGGGAGGAADGTGRGGGGGGTGIDSSASAHYFSASPSGDGAANTGRGGGGLEWIGLASFYFGGNGGSGYITFTYWGP